MVICPISLMKAISVGWLFPDQSDGGHQCRMVISLISLMEVMSSEGTELGPNERVFYSVDHTAPHTGRTRYCWLQQFDTSRNPTHG
ncbi:hypothetical protein RRG08_048557 [Elysia crispata]|uniref:Uncharacterized protein n=1 Tax=Elysia crispata TaxID=231223 RepID=A0AAE1B5N0_9GAST|nr:hypothetical protein RRG08_048557 [Elysia crispata]